MNTKLYETLYRLAVISREDILAEYGEVRGKCIICTERFIELFYDLWGVADKTSVVVHNGFVIINYLGQQYYTTHTCCRMIYQGRTYYIDPTYDQFNDFIAEPRDKIYLGYEEPVIESDSYHYRILTFIPEISMYLAPVVLN